MHLTDPLKADTDDDELSDYDEIFVHGTNPRNPDTDGDGLLDGFEVRFGLDPLKAEAPTQFRDVSVGVFYGGDPGEGLDLQGNFRYAINVGTTGAAGPAGDTTFTADDVPGVAVTAQNNVAAWGFPELGDSEADLTLNRVLSSIRWSAAPDRWRVDLLDLVPGSVYKVQLLFYEQCCSGRGFNVYGDGVVLAENFLPADWQGGAGVSGVGVVVSAEFTTARDRLTLFGDGPAATAEEISDRNATLSGVTLEVINEIRPPGLSVSLSGSTLTITFEGTLTASDSLGGAFTEVSGSSPITINLAESTANWRFFRARR